MFDDTLELAENKLLLLYIFKKVNLPISNMQLTDIVLENSFMNYFNLQQYISELISCEFLKSTKKNDKPRLIMTPKGQKVLNLFKGRISQDKVQILDNYLENQIDNIKKEITITADYTIENSNNFVVNLKASENNYTLIDIKIGVPSNKQARELCAKWKKDSSDLYKNIIKLLVDNET